MLIGAGLKRKEARVKEYLDLATFISSLVLNEKADETYKKIFEQIKYGYNEKVEENTIDKNNHFIDLAKKRGLKLPKGYN